MVIGGASGAIPRKAITRPCRGSTQQQETQPVETVSQATLGTTKTGKPRQRTQWREETNTFIMRHYYIITKLETIKIGYRRELHDRFMRQYPEMEISEQRTADQRRAIVTNQYQQNPSMEWRPVCEKDVAEALRTTLKWKALGRDKIANIWLQQLTATHKHTRIAALFNELIEDQIPGG